MPDAAKRRRADVVMHSGLSRHFAVAAIRRLLHRHSPKLPDCWSYQ
jgi:dephospho-CoA kinase